MRTAPFSRFAPLAGALLLAPGPSLKAQERGVEFTYGRWWHDTASTTFTAGVVQPLFGPFGIGVALTHLDDHLARDDRTMTGTEIALSLRRHGSGFYAVGAVGAGVLHGRSQVDGYWSLGGGYAFRIFGTGSAALGLRYRVEDRNFRGFWRLDPADRTGLVVQARIAFGIPGRGAPAARSAAPDTLARRPEAPSASPGEPPRPEPTPRTVRPRDDGGAANAVARTALAVMDTPATWGGTDDNGFDTALLIRHAYREQGIILPPMKRDQLRMGTRVEPTVADLQPGDLVGFAVEGNQVSHLGLYVGDGRFLRSASGGVAVASLTGTGAEDVWWQRRWRVARRIVD